MKTLEYFKSENKAASKFITSLDIEGRLCMLPYNQFCFEYKILSDANKPGFLNHIYDLLVTDKISHIYLANEWKEHDLNDFIETKTVEFMTSFSKEDQLRFIDNIGKKLDAIFTGDLTVTKKIINLSELKRRYVLYGNIKDVKHNRLHKEIELAIHHLKEIEPYKNIDLENNSNDDNFIDYSDSSKAERVVIMKELGLLDFLKEKMENELMYFSPNKLAEVISSFTGIEQTTLQSYLNPMYSKNVSNKNNPYNSNKNKARKKLTDMGFLF